MSRVSDRPVDAPALPTGHVTFLFTDLEDSSAAWERRPATTRLALHYHDQTASELTRAHGGVLIKHTGDGIKSVFLSPSDAVSAAIQMQRRFQQESWGGVDRMRVRIGLHTGDATPDGDDYYGGVINRAARVADVANGDQIAVTEAVIEAAGDTLTADTTFTDCGLAHLKGCGQERIYLVGALDLAVDDRPLRIRRALAGSALPPEGGRLIGRQDELERLAEFLVQRRLTSVVGLGGIGKTRLAIAAARSQSNEFADGVVYCPLSPIEESSADPQASVLSALAKALGARRQPGQDLLWSIVNFVEGRNVLLVLDNCEHVKAAARVVVEQLLSVEGPTVLLTSREPLEVRGEQRVTLEPLHTDSDAVELLIERAIERDPEFDRSAHETTLRDICRRVDGIPLALELAAARLRILTPERLLAGLEQGTGLLGSSGSGGNGLQQTIAWSVDQLDDRQQFVLEQLSVFAGGFTLDAVSDVLSVDDEMGILDDLTHLVELSLVKNHPGQGDIRFSMLETIRQFGRERLSLRARESATPNLAATLSDTHASYYGELAARCGQNLFTAAEAEVWTRIDAESDNIRVAFEHLVRAERHEEAASVVVDLAWFATLSMRMELFGWANRLLEMEDVVGLAELWAVRAIGEYLSANEDCYQSARRSLELDPADPTGLANATLASIGLNNTFDPELSGSATAEMLSDPDERCREKRIVGLSLRSFHLCLLEPNADAIDMARNAVAEAEATASASAMTIGYWAQAVANLVIDWPTADDGIKRGLAMAESLTNNHLISHLLNGLVVHFAALAGPVEEAAAISAAEIRATMDKHYLVGASHLLGAASVVLCRAGRADDGAALLGAMIDKGHRPRRDVRKTVEAAVGADVAMALSAGRSWSINEAGHLAIAWLDEVAAKAPAPR